MEVPGSPGENTEKAPENQDSVRKESTPVDIKEYPSKYVFKADVPGLKSHQIRVQVSDNNVLTISGKRQKDEGDDKDEENDVKFVQIERKFGKFMRNFTLPPFCKHDAISALCIDGVLTISIPKLLPVEQNKATTIQVEVEGKDNSAENDRGLINGVSVVEESLSNTASPNISFNQQHFQGCMRGDEQCNPQKQNSCLNSEQNAKEENGTRRMDETLPSDAELEIASSDFVMEAKGSKNELWPQSTIAVFILKFEEVYNSVNHDYLAKRHWDQVANETNKICNSNLTGLQCRYKWNRLRKIYTTEKLKLNATGAKISMWPFYADFDRILGKTRKIIRLIRGCEKIEWDQREHYTLSMRNESEVSLNEDPSIDENLGSILHRQKDPYHLKGRDGEGKRVKRVQAPIDSMTGAMETNIRSLTETMKEIEQNKMRQESMQLDKILQTQLQREHYNLSTRKQQGVSLYEDASMEENQDLILLRQKEPYHLKDKDGEGKRVKRVQATMDSIAEAMETNMRSLTETMKEIEQNKMRQESMQLDKILQTQLQIARLFAQK
eukprot:TRINITY_DN2254_c0_g3_i1.p1 TRINITY_DN2254_c0_g3~~TRINITY_DN2254_c0_g3_i1.p1  ORF type:complete len:553 (-),score=107.45 TRINITY_DN2254_c0_g3_i1:378-2036(-)